ncbi:RNA polymerase subunit sigma-70, partial [Actinospica acidiphila]|nr:RNA polymerase subunit sigma-70 [Actinospica acidiphila]
DAFRAAARTGDFEALLAVLHPDVVLRADAGALVRGVAGSKRLRGAQRVAESAMLFSRYNATARMVLVNGAPGLVSVVDGRVGSVLTATVHDGRITALYILADPDRLGGLLPPDEEESWDE